MLLLLYLGFIAGIYLLLLYPSRPKKDTAVPFQGRNYAHRGLYRCDQTIPENSLVAFRLAVEAGYGIELDLQLSRDGDVVVFHDDSLSRICGVPGNVSDYGTEELRHFCLFETEEGIPLFSEVLRLINGRVPMIIEFKTSERNTLLCKKAIAELDTYHGPYCIESFDPRILLWFRRNRPNILRGQLACNRKKYGGKTNPLFAFFASRCLLNFISKPNFIAYEIGKKPFSVRLSELLGAIPVCWTSHYPENEIQNDMVIFEYYHPKTHYRI